MGEPMYRFSLKIDSEHNKALPCKTKCLHKHVLFRVRKQTNKDTIETLRGQNPPEDKNVLGRSGHFIK